MHNARRHAPLDPGERRSAKLIVRWIDEHLGLIGGLIALRELGPDAELALDAVLGLPEVLRARLSWELVDALCAGVAKDLDAFLLQEIPFQRLQRAQLALWG